MHSHSHPTFMDSKLRGTNERDVGMRSGGGGRASAFLMTALEVTRIDNTLDTYHGIQKSVKRLAPGCVKSPQQLLSESRNLDPLF